MITKHIKTGRYAGVGSVKRGPRSGEDALSWQARIRVGLKKIAYLGMFATQEEAAQAYDNAAYYLHLEGRSKPTLNFPEDYLGLRDSPPPLDRTEKAVELFKASRSSRLNVRKMRSDADVLRLVEGLRWELKLMPPLLGGPKHLEAATQLAKATKLCQRLEICLLPHPARSSSPVAHIEPSAAEPKTTGDAVTPEAKAEPLQPFAVVNKQHAPNDERQSPNCNDEHRAACGATGGPATLEAKESSSIQKSSETRSATQPQITISVGAGVNN